MFRGGCPVDLGRLSLVDLGGFVLSGLGGGGFGCFSVLVLLF